MFGFPALFIQMVFERKLCIMNKAVRKAVIAGNWKMNKTPAEAKELLNAIAPLGKGRWLRRSGLRALCGFADRSGSHCRHQH